MRHIACNGFKRISKIAAKRMFEAGEDIYLLPCNVAPGSVYILPAMLCKDNSQSFSNSVNAFEIYNCNTEVGKYAAYYIQDKTV